MPSKKKTGSASANGQRPLPVQRTSSDTQRPISPNPTSLKTPSNPPANRSLSQPETSETTSAPVNNPNSLNEDVATLPAVNRKKQKRRQKQAAKLAQQHLNNGLFPTDEQGQNGHVPYPGRGPQKGFFTEGPDFAEDDFADGPGEVEDAFFSGEEADVLNPHSQGPGSKKSKKKKKNKKTTQLLDEVRATSMAAASLLERSALATQQALAAVDTRTAQQKKRDQIWNDSKNAERENMKLFWLGLDEVDRRSLVQIEKDDVLRKMKEQRSSCNCTMCGRKRLAIEEELEVLYDAYYDELEHYIHPHPEDASQDRQLMPPHPRPRSHHPCSHVPPGHFEDPGDEEDYDDEFDDEDEDYSEDDFDEVQGMPVEFYHFSNSLRVKDGLLTVADDLLKNGGEEFINMMDKLANRRVQREEEARFPQNSLSHQHHHGHNHPPLDEDDYDDEEDDEEDDDYDSQELEDDEEMDALTEEQRMEEGRRMFQLFAARMFEQRVITAYREKVARERQQKLIEELDEESRLDTQREAKKAKEAAKKKEKKRLQKQARDEEKAKKEAEKAAQEAEARAAEEKKLEEQRHRREEQRKKREAEKKAQEEERLKKEADRQRKLQEERERQATAERKQREAKEREKKQREDARRREREEREAKDRKQKEERERKAKEEDAKKQKDAATKADRESKEKPKVEHDQQTKRPPVALPPGLHPQPSNAVPSPHVAVATPIVPKAPTPARPRQASQQGHASHTSSPRSQQAGDISQTSASPASGSMSQTPVSSIASGKPQDQQPVLHHPQPSAPLSPLNQPGRQNFPLFNGMQGMSNHGPPGMMHHTFNQVPMYQGPPMGGQHRGFGYPNNAPLPSGINGNRPYNQRQGNPSMPYQGQGPMQPPNSMSKEPGRSQPHSRQQSGTFDRPQEASGQPQPISRPAPIQRPSSTTPDKKNKRRSVDPEVETLATQLGSKALLDDSDVPLSAAAPNDQTPAGGLAPGSGRVPSFTGFHDQTQPSKRDAFHIGPNTPQANTWAFGTSPSGVASSTWGPSPPINPKPGLNAGWPGPTSANNGPPATNAFGGMPMHVHAHHRPHHASRPVAIRILAAQACRSLGPSTFHAVNAVHSQITQIQKTSLQEPPVAMSEILDILDTEGNHQNGGGSFLVRGGESGPQSMEVRFDEDDGTAGLGGTGSNTIAGPPGGRPSLGDIGSPVIGHMSSHLHHPHQPQHHHHHQPPPPPMQGFGGIGSRF